jgi:hypothetical protein
VDHIDFQVNPVVERKFVVRSLEKFGTPAIPMHLAIFNIPLTFAVQLGIPLVVYGENSAAEYGGAQEDLGRTRMDSAWVRTYGVTHGTTARDWVGDGLSEEELTPYLGPTDDELGRTGVHAIFLGAYFPWDPMTSLRVATAHGFRSRVEGPRTGSTDYADLDDDFISVHHHLKWYKFGFTRSFDTLSLDIRNRRRTRSEAVDWLRKRGDETPREDIDRFCEYAGMSTQTFFGLIERFRNRDIWVQRRGLWEIEGFLIPDWRWS